jgi:hypothetical protein
MDLVWTCSCCGKQYDKLSFAYALDEPDRWGAVPRAERRHRGVLGSDTCVIDQREFYIRGRIVIPVLGYDEPFIWGLWASVSRDSFERFGQLWDIAARDQEPPFLGRLGSDIPIYPKTFDLSCHVHLKNARRRPSIMLDAIDHPLAIEQRDGITLDRVKEIAAVVLRHSSATADAT